MMMSIEPVQLVKEAQQEVFVSNGQMAPNTLKEDQQEYDAAVSWLDQHAPAMQAFMLVQRVQDHSATDQPIDWIDTSWSNGTSVPQTIEMLAGGAGAIVRRDDESQRK
jgi:hypothetical protein